MNVEDVDHAVSVHVSDELCGVEVHDAALVGVVFIGPQQFPFSTTHSLEGLQ